MASNLSHEFQRFCTQAKHLRQLLRDTQKCFAEINSSPYSDQNNGFSAEFSVSEEDDIHSIVKQQPCLIILGQTSYARALIVNEVLGQNILPVENYDEQAVWRGINFAYGEATIISLSLAESYELVDNLSTPHGTNIRVSAEDLEVTAQEAEDEAPFMEIRLHNPLLHDGGLVRVMPTWTSKLTLTNLYQKLARGVVPVVIYGVSHNCLSNEEHVHLTELRNEVPDIVVFFVRTPPKPQEDNVSVIQRIEYGLKNVKSTLSRNNVTETNIAVSNDKGSFFQRWSGGDRLTLFEQLINLGYLSILPSSTERPITDSDSYTAESELVESFDNFPSVVPFTRQLLQAYLIKASSLLNLVHTRCLQTFILSAFDMQRDMLITPRKLEFAKKKESQLYGSLMEIALKKQDEIKDIITETIQDMREDLLEKAAGYDFIGVYIPPNGEVTSASDLKVCSGQIQDLVLGNLNSAVAGKLLGSVSILKDSYTGVLARCLESLEKSDRENSESARTSMALKEILNSAYQVDITVRSGASFIKILLEKMKQLVHSMPWSTPPRIDRSWKSKVAAEMLENLSEARLAKSICAQIKERLRNSHDTFSSALRQLEARHSGRLERTEEQRLKVRKVHAPRVARLVLESSSLKDHILFGMPQLGREIGRGQYGVVYSCDKWAGCEPCAVKTVVPPDDKHWNDLALEFYYTKNVPGHDRIVAVRGSVIDYTYGGGPAVLICMERLQRDMYAAIRAGLEWPIRLQVAIDVVEGIRFLHSQGLVHRDIKLKNILLDENNRALVTDLGFCKPEAMMSGSIVGTPIHMAPELFTGRYDSSVDVYAFGILMWYVCAGHVKLPQAFEQCSNKEMLWTSVKRGIRPERLPKFDDTCWNLMSSCWVGDPQKRPLLGDVEPQLHTILQQYSRGRKTARSMSTSPTRPVQAANIS